MTAQEKDAKYAETAAKLVGDASIPAALRQLADDPRVTVRRGGAAKPGGQCVVYWMQRSQRAQDNHALDKAIACGNALGLPVVVFMGVIKNFPHGNLRHYAFLGQGLADIAQDCAERGVGFVLRRYPDQRLVPFVQEVDAALVIGDENPLRVPERWRVKVADQLHKELQVPLWTVDADVIVPSRLLEKAQFSAAVARPRLYRALAEFLVPYQNPKADVAWKQPRGLHALDVPADITEGWTEFDRSVVPVAAWTGGTRAGLKRLKHFCDDLLAHYDRDRNHPEVDGSSKMSPYLHFGHVGAQTIALAVEAAVKKHPHLQGARDSYLNELVAWRELSVNFVRYQPEYDSPACADNWAQQTIAEHAKDEREWLYTLAQLEAGETHDDLWNAGQLQMVRHGWMHNYLRMYWAKKMLEWTPDIATAMKWAIHLNDKYELDGRDPGGYAGIAWSMLGKFDRTWFDRPIFGKLRYMSRESTGKKFDSQGYIEQVSEMKE